MKYVAIYFLILIFLAVSHHLFAQSYYVPQKVSPSSPEASNIEKFVDYPVSQFTGVSSVNVPIYSIDLGSFNLPISAAYHGSGIKIDDIPSNIGMGWSLLAGGSISIQVNGLLDERVNGFNYMHPQFNKVKNLSFNTTFPAMSLACSGFFAEDPLYYYTGQDIEFLRGLHFGIDDSEPDIYAFNFGGQSGKFFEDEKGVFRTIPFSKMKIVRKYNSGSVKGYEITDEGGNVFEFFQLEESQTNTYNLCTPNPNNISQQGVSRSYHLTKVRTPLNETIELTYRANGCTAVLQKQITRSRYLNPNSPCITGPGGTGNANIDIYNCASTTTMDIGGMQIDSINASNGAQIVFSYSVQNRLDIPAKSLERVEVRSKYDGKAFRSFDFIKDYWCGRLRLTSIREGGKPPYQFIYDNDPLPARLSTSQDHWGYYNGATNATLLPKDEFNGFNSGADREPNPVFVQAGMLKKVIYPTGGFSEYIYEPNEYFVSSVTLKQVKEVGATLSSFPNQTRTYAFTVPSNSSRHILTYTNTYDGTVLHNDYCYIRIYGPNNYVLQLVGSDPYKSASLQPGDYTLEIENVGSTYQADITIQWFNAVSVPPHNEIGGGLRIKEIKAKDGMTSTAVSKKFEYYIPGTKNSSGVNMYEPAYFEIYDETRLSVSSCVTYPSVWSCQSRVQSSISKAPLSFSNGYHVGYSDVTEYNNNKSENGYTYTKYIIDNSNSLSAPSSPPYPPQINYDWVNGLPVEQNVYKAVGSQFEIVSKTKSTYNYMSFDKNASDPNLFTMYGAKSMLVGPPRVAGYCNLGCISEILSSISFGLQRYQLYSSWHYLVKTEEYLFSNPTSYLYKATEYFYDNPGHLKPTRWVTSNSKGERILTTVKYPMDYVDLSNTTDLELGISGLQNKNIIAAEIEKTVHKSNSDGTNDRVVSSFFNIFHTQFPVVKTIKAMERLSPISDFAPSHVNNGVVDIDPRYKDQGYYAINNNGRIIQQKKVNDIAESYVWGYDGKLPVAVITGAEYADVQSVGINGAILSNPSSDVQLRDELNKLRQQLSDALVKTFTYKPLFGVTSEVNENGKINYNEYDVYGRLGIIRDHDNNILRKICYTYTGQQENCDIGLYNSTRSKTFTKVCSLGGTGSTHTYYATRTSNISQYDADQQAQSDVDTNGQQYANSIGTCLWTNDAISGNYYKNNCVSGQTANPYLVNIQTGLYTSTVSKADANQAAQNAAQVQANTYGTCSGGQNVTLYSSNVSGLTGWVVQLTNVNTSQIYGFSVSANRGMLGQVPRGDYNIRIYNPSGTSYWAYFEFCFNYTSGYEGNLYNMSVGECTEFVISN
jgi:hypothetical protein